MGTILKNFKHFTVRVMANDKQLRFTNLHLRALQHDFSTSSSLLWSLPESLLKKESKSLSETDHFCRHCEMISTDIADGNSQQMSSTISVKPRNKYEQTEFRSWMGVNFFVFFLCATPWIFRHLLVDPKTRFSRIIWTFL